MWAEELAILNIIAATILVGSTTTFIVMLQKRFASAEFNGPRRKLITFLSIFCLSFIVRAIWDLLKLEPDQGVMAVLIFFVYFVTEFLPIFVIYIYHFWAFYEHFKMKNGKTEDAPVATPSKEE